MRKPHAFDANKFWREHDKARHNLDKKLAGLSFAEKIAIVERMKADSDALQKAKRLS